MILKPNVLRWKLKNPFEYRIKYKTNYNVTRYMFIGSHRLLDFEELREILLEADYYVDEDDEVVTEVYLVDVLEEDPSLVVKRSVRIAPEYNLRVI